MPADAEQAVPEPEQIPQKPSSDGGKNKVMAVLAYVGPLVIVSYITGRDDPFVKFHIKQGLVLVVIEGALWVLNSMFWFLSPLWGIANVIVFIFAVLGIANVINNREKNLPLIGGYSKYFTF